MKNEIIILDNQNVNFIIECLNGTYRNCSKPFSKIDSYYVPIDEFKFEKCFKFLVEVNSNSIINLTSMLSSINVTLSYDESNSLLRVLPKNSEKYNGIQKICHGYKVISFGNDREDKLTLKSSYIGVKMQNSVNLDDISFSTTSNNDDGVGKFLCNYFNLDINKSFENVKILDCTLRDGGHLNKCNFGEKNVKEIISNLVKSKIDIIEIGFLEDCKYDTNITKFNTIDDTNYLLKDIQKNSSKFSLLLQVDKFDFNKLNVKNDNIDLIRVSFHSNLIEEGMKYCKKILELGYECSCNPINFSNYSNEEVVELIKKVNEINPTYFCIVDTFGTMLNNDFSNKLSLLNNILNDDIKLGLHLHNNLSSSFSTAQIIMNKNSRFNNVIIDTSICGMGRAPGNLKTELLTYYINSKYYKYNLEYLYWIIEKIIPKFKEKYNWEEDFRYSISAFEKMHRTYAEFLINHNVSLKDSNNIMKEIPLNNKGRYDKNIIENIYNKYFDRRK